MKNRYESELMQVLHEEMQDMHRSGFISDARMREFDEMCLENPKVKKKSNSVYENDTVNLEHISHVVV